jgi:hypothetical protein
MKITHFKGCSSLSEVNSTLVQIFNSRYTDPSKRDSVYDKILQEHMYLVCTTEIIKELCGGTQVKVIQSESKPVYHNTHKWINSTYNAITTKGLKAGSIYFLYLKEMESLDLKPKEEDLNLIAKLCNYNQGWVFYKKKELNIK